MLLTNIINLSVVGKFMMIILIYSYIKKVSNSLQSALLCICIHKNKLSLIFTNRTPKCVKK